MGNACLSKVFEKLPQRNHLLQKYYWSGRGIFQLTPFQSSQRKWKNLFVHRTRTQERRGKRDSSQCNKKATFLVTPNKNKRLSALHSKELMVKFLCTFSLWSNGDYNAVKTRVTSKIIELAQTQTLDSPSVSNSSFCMPPITERLFPSY